LAVRAGMIFANESEASAKSLERFGRAFGLAFQMADDWADGEAASEEALVERLDAARRALGGWGDRAQPLHGLLDYLYGRATQADCRYR